MIELVSYSQDVPVTGNTDDAVNYLVFNLDGNTFRVRVGVDTIKDLVTAIEASPRAVTNKSTDQRTRPTPQEDFEEDPDLEEDSYRVDENEDNIPSL